MMRIVLLMFFIMSSGFLQASDALWGKLKTGSDLVVFMRNAESTGNRDGVNMLVWDQTGNCRGESVLTEQGRAQAEKAGELFRLRQLSPVVISSPMCRCRQTAEIAFGQVITAPELIQSDMDDAGKQAAFHAKASELLLQYKGEKPIVFVNHRPNIDALTMEMLNLGEMLVGKITDEGEVDVIGKIRLDN